MSVIALRPVDIDVIAAIAEAGRLLSGPDDQGTATLTSDRARKLTAAAMKQAYPRMTWKQIADCIGGFEDMRPLPELVDKARNAAWWSQHNVDEVAGCLLARYEERA